jgi:hypothetical protein
LQELVELLVADVVAYGDGGARPPSPSPSRPRPGSGWRDEHEVHEGSQGAKHATYRRRIRPNRVMEPHKTLPLARVRADRNCCVSGSMPGGSIEAEDLLEQRYPSTIGLTSTAMIGLTSTAPPIRAAGIRAAKAVAASRSGASSR